MSKHNGLYNNGNPPPPDRFSGGRSQWNLDYIAKCKRDLAVTKQDRTTTTKDADYKRYIDSKISFIEREMALLERELN
jgi:hypothetical protein